MTASDGEWLRRAAAAGYVIEKQHGRWDVLDATGKVRGRFQRRYEAREFIGRAVGRETKALDQRVQSLAERLAIEKASTPVGPVPSWSGRLPLRPGHTVYRALDSNGQVLYVGMSSRLWARIGEHRMHSPWWMEAVDLDWTIYPTRRDAEHAERDLIRQHRPPWNVVGNLPQAN